MSLQQVDRYGFPCTSPGRICCRSYMQNRERSKYITLNRKLTVQQFYEYINNYITFFRFVSDLRILEHESKAC